MFERELAVMAGDNPSERVTAVEVSYPKDDPSGGSNYLELRFEHRVGAAGWVVQRRIPIASGNISDMRMALTLFCASNNTRCTQQKVVCLAEYQEQRIA